MVPVLNGWSPTPNVTRALKLLAMTAALAAAPASAALAQSSPMAVGANIGTPGIGASVQMQTTDTLVLRGDVDWLRFGRDEEYGGVDYDGKVKSMTGGLFADWHPAGGPFLVSAGAYLGKRELEIDAQPTGNVEIGGQTFTPAQVGRIDGEARLSRVQPFLGLGFDNTFTSERAWGFRALAGVALSKRPDVNLTASGGVLSNDPAFIERLLAEEAEIEDDAEGFRYFPVLQIGFTRRF